MKIQFKKYGIKSLVLFQILMLGALLSSCSPVNKAKDLAESGLEKYNDSQEEKKEEKNEKCLQIISEKASTYGIESEGVEVTSGGEYIMVPIETIHNYDELEDQIITKRRWLRFAYNELGRTYFVGFFDSEHPEIMYGGFSNQDFGFPSEYYWDDKDILHSYTSRIYECAKGINIRSDITAEEFTEITGIDEEKAEEITKEFNKKYKSKEENTPDKNDHDIAFIPGDNIQHYEKFIVGDKDCEITQGKYSVDLTGNSGVIHITDADDNTKYRLDRFYSEGYTDELYEYSVLPVEVELNKGDIIYLRNCMATFDKISN